MSSFFTTYVDNKKIVVPIRFKNNEEELVAYLNKHIHIEKENQVEKETCVEPFCPQAQPYRVRYYENGKPVNFTTQIKTYKLSTFYRMPEWL